MSYERFAFVYDALMEDVPYDRWISMFIGEMQRAGASGKAVLDVGCGTGEFSVRLAKEGFEVSGVDLSEDMLSIAREKAGEQKVTLNLYHQNMAQLETGETYDGIVIFCDSLNYLQFPEDVKSTFAAVYGHLKPGGVFMFDVHSVHKIEDVFINATFADAGEDVSYIWNSFSGEEAHSVEHELTFFVKDPTKDVYERFEEDHYQRTYPIDTYKQWLTDTGFKIERITADFTDQSPDGKSERIMFVVSK
ncbi:class I SAM-dependent DNA methyltransferase [Bacillus sp. 1P06AnD]|uniref:class I SAM-dependent DNA methyltransferase n=1 Tax=Bacillus sp. 1P06AnD TaxID=3132208 RepID=UPI00399FF50B